MAGRIAIVSGGGIMDSIPLKLEYLFAGILYYLDPQTKMNFDRLLRAHILDQSFHRAISEGILPEWCDDHLSYEPLDGKLEGLRRLLLQMNVDLMLDRDGEARYDLRPLTAEWVADLVVRIPIQLEEVRVISERIQGFINEEWANRAM